MCSIHDEKSKNICIWSKKFFFCSHLSFHRFIMSFWKLSACFKPSILRSPFIEDFLKAATAQQPETTTMFDLLWKFYEKSGQYVAAAKILNKLADRHSTELR